MQAGGQIERHAHVVWEGGLADGAGRLTGGERDGMALTWDGRTSPGAPAGQAATSPEELIAAAHAGCYSMSLANVLGQAGRTADRLDVQARCTAERSEAGLRIAAITLEVRGAVPGLDAAEFGRLAGEAERQCPVSNSLRGNVDIRVDAQLVDS
jgi:osmotically inducible protein OsmC